MEFREMFLPRIFPHANFLPREKNTNLVVYAPYYARKIALCPY